jgi:hypothetical protein
VNYEINKHILEATSGQQKKEANKKCKYLFTLTLNSTCHCPTRIEIFNKDKV